MTLKEEKETLVNEQKSSMDKRRYFTYRADDTFEDVYVWMSKRIPFLYVGDTGNADGVNIIRCPGFCPSERGRLENRRRRPSDAELKRKPWMLDALMMLRRKTEP